MCLSAAASANLITFGFIVFAIAINIIVVIAINIIAIAIIIIVVINIIVTIINIIVAIMSTKIVMGTSSGSGDTEYSPRCPWEGAEGDL